MIAIILAGVFAGRKLDDWLQPSKPWFTMLFSFLAVLAAMYSIIRDLTK